MPADVKDGLTSGKKVAVLGEGTSASPFSSLGAAARVSGRLAYVGAGDVDGTWAAVQRSAIVTLTSPDTDQEIVALVASKKIRVLWIDVKGGATATDGLVFKSSSTALTNAYSLASKENFHRPLNDHGWFETAAGVALTADLGSGGSSATVQVGYIEVD